TDQNRPATPTPPAKPSSVDSAEAPCGDVAAVAAVGISHPQKKDLLSALEKRELPPAAKAAAEAADPALIREVIALYDVEKAPGRLRNPRGCLRSILEDPGRWGIELTSSGWHGPAPPTANGETLEQKRKRISRERECVKREREQADRSTTIGDRK